ncbi:MAG TPA: hypothetical protein VIV11_41985 [Kofleriaceae bacterium]
MTRCLLALALAGCGEVAVKVDAAMPDDAAIDASPDAAGPSGPFLAIGNFATSSVTFYAPTDSGNIAPHHVLAGAATLLATPKLAAAGGELFATGGTRVTVYPATASGDVAPTRTIMGAATGLAGLTAIAVSANELFVVSGGASPSIRVFAADANGDVAPTRIIAGSNTALSSPLGIAVFGGEIFIANNGSSTVTVYPVGGTGNIAPLRSLSGMLLVRPSGIDVAGNELLVEGTDYVQVYARTASGTAVLPTRSITGPATGLDFSFDIFVHNGEIFTHHRNNNAVLVYPLSGNGDITPSRTISGAATMLNSPQSCVVIP